MTGRSKHELGRLASFPQLNPHPVIEVDYSGNIIFSNPAVEKVLEDLKLDKRDITVFLPSDFNVILRDAQKEQKMSCYREVMIKDRTFGEAISLAPEFKAVRIYAQDITERKYAEDRLRLFFTAVEDAPDGVQIVDLSGRIIYSNKAVQKIYGFSPEEYLGRHVSEMNADPEFAGKVILPAIRETGEWSGELIVKHKCGSVFPIRLTTSLIKDDKGEPVAMVGIIRDITERKRSEETLRELNARLHTLIHEIPDVVFFTDTTGRYLLANKATEEFMGLRQQELIGRTNEDLLPQNLFESCKQSDNEVLKNLKPVHVEEHYFGDKGEKYFDTIKAPVFDNLNNVVGIVAICRDITERKMAEEEREKLILGLQDALAHVKTLKGLLPICAWCKKIRDDKGYWTKVETYIREHSDVSFTHGICPECLKKESPETYDEVFGTGT